MSDDKYQREALTEEEARLRHPDAEVLHLFSIGTRTARDVRRSSCGGGWKTRTRKIRSRCTGYASPPPQKVRVPKGLSRSGRAEGLPLDTSAPREQS
jgi:hypothetical protein